MFDRNDFACWKGCWRNPTKESALSLAEESAVQKPTKSETKRLPGAVILQVQTCPMRCIHWCTNKIHV